MRKFLILTTIFILMISIAVPAANAQAPDWSYTFDFTTGRHGWTEDYCHWLTGIGFESTDGLPADFERCTISYTFTEEATVTDLDVTYDNVSTGWSEVEETLSGTQLFYDGTLPQGIFTTEWSGSETGEVLTLRIEGNHQSLTNRYITAVTISGGGDDPFLPPYSDFYWPVTTDDFQAQRTLDELSIGNIIEPSIISVLENSYAYASATGTVISVWEDAGWNVVLLATVNGTDFQFDYQNLVEVYVEEGDLVTAGCALGRAGPPFYYPDNIAPGADFSQIIYAARVGTTYIDWSQFNLNDGSAGVCEGIYNDDTCINLNPSFYEGWGTGFVGWSVPYDPDLLSQQGEIYLKHGHPQSGNLGAIVYQDLVLTASETYSVTVAGMPVDGDTANITIQIANDSELIALEPATPGQRDYVTVELTPTAYSSPPDVFRLLVRNSDSLSDVIIEFICLQVADGDIDVERRSQCYFPNNEFEDDTGWTLTGTADVSTWGDGVLRLNATTDTATHDVDLPADDTETWTYLVDIAARALPYDEPEDNATITVTYDGDTITDSTTMDFPGQPDLLIRTHSIAVAPGDGDQTGTYEIELTTLDANVSSVEIAWICLYAPDGWPDEEDLPGDPPAPWEPSCYACARPTGLDVGAWLSWLGCIVGSLVRCDLIPLLRAMIGVIQSILSLTMMITRWLLGTIATLIPWLFDLVVYIASTIVNYLFGALELLWNALMSLEPLINIFDLLAIAMVIIEAIMALITSLAQIALLAISALGALAEVILSFFSSLSTAINAETTETVGAPACAAVTSESDWYIWCLGIYLVDYVISKFPAVSVLTTALMGMVGYYTISKTIARVGESFGEVG